MQKAFLVVNKSTQIASYLQHRSILDITEEHRSLSELDPTNMPIVDVDKLILIVYPTDDEGLSFRSDMNMLRNLLASAFFNADELVCILVDCTDALAEDLILSATRGSSLTKDKITVIQHSGVLMLGDVGKYLAGSAIGQSTSSTYKAVYVREADKEEKDRFENTKSSEGLDAILPVLTDMASLYKQRAHVEAISAGHVVAESATRPETVSDFSHVEVATTKTLPLFVVSGDQWTGSERGVGYLVEYTRIIGRRVLVINTDPNVDIANYVGESVTLLVQSVKVSSTPTSPVAVMNARFNQLGFIVQFLHNILGIEEIIFNVCKDDYKQMCKFARQMSEDVSEVFISHFNANAVESFLRDSLPASALFLTFEVFHDMFDLESYREDLKGIVVAKFPVEDVDVIEFRDLATGSKGDEESEE